ncbi:MAG TPA: amidohydrolase family protein [Solirubrobacterales bacterium]|jgi:L-fuconolactonase
MEILDAQIHRPLPLVPWPEFDPYAGYPREGGDVLDTGPSGEIQLRVGVELALAGMEAAGVDGAIVYSHPDFCEAAVCRHPEKLASVYDFYEPGELGDPDAFMRELRARPGLLGIRLLPGIDYAEEHNLALLTDGHWDSVLLAAQRHEVPVVFFIPLQLRHIHPIARRFPELRIVIDHCGMPAPPTAPPLDDLLETLPELLALAEYPHVAVKLTGLPVLQPDPYPFAAIWPTLHRMIEAFGPERLLWGSDVHRITGGVWAPPLHVAGFADVNYSELVGYLLHTEEIGEADKATMLATAARSWFNWPRPEPA